MRLISAALCFGAVTLTASADIQVERLGMAAPPTVFRGARTTPAPFDSRIFQDVPSLPDGLGGQISFSEPMSCRQVGMGWSGDWSHGYAGNVYFSDGLTDITVTFAPGTKLAYMYLEPNPFGTYDLTLTGSDGATTVSRTEGIELWGAVGYLFYTNDFAGQVVSVRVTSDVDFAIGEFGTSRIPAPAALPLLALAGLTAARRRR